MAEEKLDDPSSAVAEALTAAAGLLDETAELLDGIPDETKKERQQLYRADSAVASGRALIALADPRVTPQALANEVRERVGALRDNVQPVASGGDGGNIKGAVEPLLASLVQLRQPGAPLEEKAKEAARRYSQSLAPRMRALRGEIEKLEARLSELNREAAEEATAASKRLTDLKAETEAASTRVEQLISDQDSKFTEAQEKRREEHAAAINEAGDRLGEATAEFEKRKEEAAARLGEIKEEVAEAAAAIGASTAGVDHAAEYNQQKGVAFWWHPGR